MDQFSEDQQYELNARYDYIKEAFGDIETNALSEDYCSYCMECDQDGQSPLEFAHFVKMRNSKVSDYFTIPIYNSSDDIPF